MGFSAITPESLSTALDDLKRRNAGKRGLTNYFFTPLKNETNLRALCSERSICFVHDEWDFARVYFQSYDPEDLQQCLAGVEWPPIAVLDWITKEGSARLEPVLSCAGFHLHGVYDRIVCNHFQEGPLGSDLTLATEEQCSYLHCSLFRIFDKYADHIMPQEELRRLILEQQVLISQGPTGAINGFVVFPIANQNCNFNFLYNEGGLGNLTRLLQGFYGLLGARQVKAGFSWVRRTRPLVLKLHKSFGWKTDGLTDYIYVRS